MYSFFFHIETNKLHYFEVTNYFYSFLYLYIFFKNYICCFLRVDVQVKSNLIKFKLINSVTFLFYE